MAIAILQERLPIKMEDEGMVLLKVWLIILISLSYSYLTSSKIPSGKLRLLFLLPVFTLHSLLPLSLSSTLPTGITAFFITWLANFKLLLFSFNLGPLSPSLSLPKFILTAAFPVKIKGSPSPLNPKPTKILPLNLWSKALIFAILVALCDHHKSTLPQWAVLGVYCAMLYLFIDVILGVSNMIVGSTIGVELEPPSDEPYAATSLQDFWGRRWNLMVTDTLRYTVYLPLRVFLSKYLGKASASAAAIATSFLVSGLMHELIFYYMSRVRPTWEVTWFFVLHGLCVVVEVALKRALGPKLRFHWVVTGPLTVGFVMGTGFWWFFPPLVRNQADARAIEEAKTLYEFIKAIFKGQ
uniref:Long-chain-alcohol O-fatty-acyltransferase n=1 Tax=Opuntia streptacantha TaxID=393608 RepID=A0A7C9A4Q4_OPUST